MKRILLIGIDRIITLDMGEALKNMGYDVEYAIGKEEGIEKIRQSTYNLIIINNLPKDDGERFYQDVFEISQDSARKILFISGEITEFIKTSGNPFLPKPFTDEELIDLVKRLLS
ncbi:MAG TPA: response regulator [Thermodesulfobacteriota bacterium]|nr:response regulator [Thermodesulfobacteriota bacterium]